MALSAMIQVPVPHHNHMKAMISLGYPHFRSMEVHGGKGVVPREPLFMDENLISRVQNFVLSIFEVRRESDSSLAHVTPHKWELDISSLVSLTLILEKCLGCG
jgi:hypothetical protein